MPSQGSYTPGSVTQFLDASGAVWANLGNVAASDGVRASVSLSGFQYSRYALFYNFGFSIPAGATITGITATLERSANFSNSIKDETIQLALNSSLYGSNLALSTFYPLTASETAQNYTDGTWGYGWNVDQVNNSEFGLIVRVQRSLGAPPATAYLDYVALTVEYTTGVSTSGKNSLMLTGVGV